MTIKIKIEDLNVYFGGAHAVKNVSLDIPQNRVTAIIGPSGCGKSTILRSINRMHDMIPAARVTGRIIIDTTDVYDRTSDPVMIRRRIGMVFQKPNPFPAMSIYDNVIAGYKLSGRLNKGDADD